MAVRPATPCLDDAHGPEDFERLERWSNSHLEIVVNKQQLLTVLLALERMEEEIRGLDIEHIAGSIEDYELEQFRLPRLPYGGLMDQYRLREWLGCLYAHLKKS